MNKYLTVFAVSWQNEFVYRLNFILWRVRVVFHFLMVYFLWTGVFSTTSSIFGYDQSSILTYIFGTLLVATFVTSQTSMEIGADIANGNISNYFIRPIGYLRYWFTRDVANKLLNVGFSFLEVIILFLIFKPNLTFPSDPIYFIFFLISLILAALIFFFMGVSVRSMAFWSPDNTWAGTFLFIVILDVLSGAIFPLDIVPGWLYTALQFTPFPYIAYFPTAFLIGKFDLAITLRILLQSAIWVILLSLFTLWIWRKGIKAYAAEGK